jgi:hypothetical protein
MGRWIAIGRAPGWDDLETFTGEMEGSANWRTPARATITEVLALDDGRLIAECHAGDRAAFEAWLSEKGWQVESITPIRHIARTGDIWKAR